MATITYNLYASFVAALANKEIDWSGDDLRLTAHTSTYSPNAATHDYVDDLSNELSTGGGYTAGGVALASATITKTAADSWAQQWAASTAYLVGHIRRPTTGNGFVYRVAVAGTSDSGEPTWPTTIGETVTDGTVTWTCVGRSVISLDAADLSPAWASFSAGPFRHLVLSDRTPGSNATRPLIGYYSYGSDQTGGGGDFDITFDPAGIIAIPVP